MQHLVDGKDFGQMANTHRRATRRNVAEGDHSPEPGQEGPTNPSHEAEPRRRVTRSGTTENPIPKPVSKQFNRKVPKRDSGFLSAAPNILKRDRSSRAPRVIQPRKRNELSAAKVPSPDLPPAVEVVDITETGMMVEVTSRICDDLVVEKAADNSWMNDVIVETIPDDSVECDVESAVAVQPENVSGNIVSAGEVMIFIRDDQDLEVALSSASMPLGSTDPGSNNVISPPAVAQTETNDTGLYNK
jgi:hypothetical protein